MKYILYFMLVVIAVDMLGFMAWRLSGQVAPDKYHAGMITESIVNR